MALLLFLKYLIIFIRSFIRSSKHVLECFSKLYFYTNGNRNVVTVVASVYILVLSLDPDSVFVEGYLLINIVLLGLYIVLLLFEDQNLVESCCNF